MVGSRQGWERVQARASRRWPPPDPTGSNCALGSPSLQPGQLQSPEDQLPERTTGLAWKQKHAKTWVHQKWRKGLGGGGHWHFLLPTLLQKCFWSCFALTIRMNSGPRRNRDGKASLFPQSRRPPVPSLASEGQGAREGGYAALPSRTSPPAAEQRSHL